MNLIKNRMNVALIGLDVDTQGVVGFLRGHGYSVFVVSESSALSEIENVTKIDEGYLFKNLNSFDFAVRSRNVEALNPNIILLREIIPVYNPISFFLDMFDCKEIFVCGGNVIMNVLINFLNYQGFTAFKYGENDSCWSMVDSLSDSSVVVVQVSPRDMIDMYFMPDIMLVENFPRDESGAAVIENYIRCHGHFSQMKGKLFNVIGEIDGVMKKLKVELSDCVSLFSTKDNQADFFIDQLNLVNNQDLSIRGLKKEPLSRFSEKIQSPASNRHLVQVFALSNTVNFRKWTGIF